MPGAEYLNLNPEGALSKSSHRIESSSTARTLDSIIYVPEALLKGRTQ